MHILIFLLLLLPINCFANSDSFSITVTCVPEYVKINNDTYEKRTVITEVIDKTVLESEIKELETKIAESDNNLIAIPNKIDDRIAGIIQQKNDFTIGEKLMFEERLKEKQELLSKLK